MMKKIILLLIISTFYFSGFSQNSSTSSESWDNPGITENIATFEPKIYPNPCKLEKVTIELPEQEISEIKLTNIAGKEVLLKKFDFTENKKQIQLTEIPNGIYLIRIKTTDNKFMVKKLIVARN